LSCTLPTASKQPRQGRLAPFERLAPQIVAVEFEMSNAHMNTVASWCRYAALRLRPDHANLAYLCRRSIDVDAGFRVLAAYTLPHLTRSWGLTSTWIAERSKKSAQSRIVKLTQDLERINELKSNPDQYIASLVSDVGQLVLWVGVALFFFIFALTIVMVIDVSDWFELIDPSIMERRAAQQLSRYGGYESTRVTAFYGVLFTIVVVGAIFRAAYVALRLLQKSNLDRRVRFLNEQVQRLRSRWDSSA
jgi:hypothetical protein